LFSSQQIAFGICCAKIKNSLRNRIARFARVPWGRDDHKTDYVAADAALHFLFSSQQIAFGICCAKIKIAYETGLLASLAFQGGGMITKQTMPQLTLLYIFCFHPNKLPSAFVVLKTKNAPCGA
jgi:hypothetical protein